MKRSVWVLSIFLSAPLVLSIARTASADQITYTPVSGNWHDAIGDPSILPVITNGAPTSIIRWGAGSGYDFTQTVPGTQMIPPIPTPYFPLGIFTHHNHTNGTHPLKSVELDVVLSFNINGMPAGPKAFTFKFTHDETANNIENAQQTVCPYLTPPGSMCSDKVSFVASPLPTTFNIGGVDYTLEMSFVDENNNPVSQFITQENQDNIANLRGRFIVAPPPVTPPNTVEKPTFNPNGGIFTGSVLVSIQTATPGASIRYTLDGVNPTATSTLYAGPITITTDTTIKAMGFKATMNNSAIGNASFAIVAAPPPPPPPAPSVLTSIWVSPQVANILTNAQAKFIATGFDQYGATMTLATPFVWTNDLTPANSINSSGLYQAGSNTGSDVVRATNQGIQGSASVTIGAITLPPPPPPGQPPVLTSIRVTPDVATVGANLQAQFKATAYDQYGMAMTLGTPFVWSNDNNPPNSIDGSTGLFQAGGVAGTDIVSATNQGHQGTASVTITLTPPTNPPPAAHRHLVISPHHATMHVGDTLPFTVLSVDNLGNSMPVTPNWSVNGAGTISAVGLFTALDTAPSATLTASMPNNDPDTATVDILAAGASTDISNAYAYPVPFKSTQGTPGITFANLAPNTKIRLFTSTAKEIRSLYSNLGEPVIWDVRNMNGDRAASGVYFYIIDNSNTHQTKKGKVVVIQ